MEAEQKKVRYNDKRRYSNNKKSKSKSKLKKKIARNSAYMGRKIVNSAIVIDDNENNSSGYLDIEYFNEKLKNNSLNKIKNKIFNRRGRRYSSYSRAESMVANIKIGIETIIKVGKSIFANKYVLIAIGVVLLLIILINNIASITAIFGVAETGLPDIEIENATKLVNMMDRLDANCSRNLKSDFIIEGDIDTDWTAALSLLVGYYENDLSDFEEEIIMNEGGTWTGTYSELINAAANLHGVSPYLIAAIIRQESNFNPNSVSYAGAIGLMQLMPSTAEMVGCSNPYDPYQNVMAGTKYIKMMLDRYDNNMVFAIAAYNAGPGHVDEYGGIPPFSQTQEYVIKVTGYYSQYCNGAQIEDGEIVGSEVVGNSKLTQIYNCINNVSDDHSKLTRKSFDEALDELSFTDTQKDMAQALYECDLWSEVFNEETSFEFKLIGSYNDNLDIENVTGDRGKIIEVARSILGTPYVWGGKCPASQIPTGLDCSGYVAWVYEKALGVSSLQAGGTSYQIQLCDEISESDARPGDIVFNYQVSHVLIYAGKRDGVNYFYHAPQPGDVVKCATYGALVKFYRLRGVNLQE